MSNVRKLLFSSAVFASSFFVLSGFAFADGLGSGKVTGDIVNLRKSPAVSSKVVTQLTKGVSVSILDQSDDWYKISCDNITGWVSDQYISVKKQASLGQAVVTKNDVYLRTDPSKSSDVVTTLSKNAKLTVYSSSGDWYKVKTSDGTTGWVSKQFAVLGSEVSEKSTGTAAVGKAVVTSNDVRLRSKPGTSSDVITTLSKSAKLSVLDSSDGWYKVKTSDGTTGWVNKQFAVLNTTPAVREVPKPVRKVTATLASRGSTAPAASKSDSSASGDQLVDFAQRLLGVPYVWGGSSPEGFDCSGFTWYVYNNYGIHLNRIAADQAKQGIEVSMDNLQPGDLVFFDTNGGHNYINHVGMYIGNGKFIQASSGGSKVMISNVTTGFYAGAFMTARRIND